METRRIKCRITGGKLVVTRLENIRKLDRGEQLSAADVSHGDGYPHAWSREEEEEVSNDRE